MGIHNNNIRVLDVAQHDKAGACRMCMKKSDCLLLALDGEKNEAAATRGVASKIVQPGQKIYQAGEKFDGIYLVKSGFFKSFYIDAGGEMQVTGFYFPGEVFGIDGIETSCYSDSVEALDTGSVCRIPPELFKPGEGLSSAEQSADNKRLVSLVNIIGGAFARDRRMIFSLGKLCSRRRFATFLLDVSQRMERSGYSGTEFKLCMSRMDIANFLCLALETISRLFTQFHTMGVIRVDRRNVEILDMAQLRNLASHMPEEEVKLKKVG